MISKKKIKSLKPFAIINARMNSSRFRNKILKKINNKTILEYLVSQINKSKIKDNFIINTSSHKSNKKLINFCKKKKYKYHIGPENDLLKRTRLCAENQKNIDYFVNIFSDGPLIDHNIINKLINIFKRNNYDFLSNDIVTSYPPGNELQVLKKKAIIKADDICFNKSIRQHSTLFIKQNPRVFKLKSVIAQKKYIRPDINLELDTFEDYKVLKNIINNISIKNISLMRIIQYLDKFPKIKKINSKIRRRWKKFRK